MPMRKDLPDINPPRWFKVWFVFCALTGLVFLGCAVWAVYTIVTWLTSRS